MRSVEASETLIQRQSGSGGDGKASGSIRLKFIAAVIAYALLLQWAYIGLISPTWGYAGFTYDQPTALVWAGAFLCSILPAFWLRIAILRPSAWLNLFLYLTVFIPFCFLAVFQEHWLTNNGAHRLPLVVTLTVCMALLAGFGRVPRPVLARRYQLNEAFWIGLAGFAAIGSVTTFIAYGRSMQLIGLQGEDIYAQRFSAARSLETLPTLASYILPMMSGAINPLLIAYGLVKKRWLFVALGFGGQMLQFFGKGARSAPAVILLSLALLYCLKKTRMQKSGICFIGMLCAFLIATATFSRLADESISVYGDWAMFRTLYEPAKLINFYANYFDENPHTYFSHVNGLGWIADNPYDQTPLHAVVGRTIGRLSDHNANVNLWGDGYAAAGLSGVLLVTVVLGGVLYLADWAAQGLDTRFAILSFVGHALHLQNTPVFTSFLTGGLALTLILLFLVPPERDETTAVISR